MPEQHVGFLVEGSRTVLHVGDAATTPDNFAVLKGLARVDLASASYFWLDGGTIFYWGSVCGIARRRRCERASWD